MKFFSILLIIVSTIFLFYCLYKMYQKKVLKEKNILQKENYLQNLQQKLINEDIDEESRRVYKLNTHKVQYSPDFRIFFKQTP